MGRLFWKIFLWFWLTLVLVMITSNWVTAKYLQLNSDDQNNSWVRRVGQSRIDSLANVIKFSGEDAARRILKNTKQRRRFSGNIFVYDEKGQEILGREADRKTRPQRQTDKPRVTLKRNITDPWGRHYVIKGNFLNRSRNRPIFPLFERQFKKMPWLMILWVGVALLLSSAICFWLAWYLTRPIQHLQRASQKLADGNLDTRVAQHMGTRRDEITDLGKDFDHMAERLQKLVLSQKQLLSDISHELRSPLARLQIAVGLAHKKTGKTAVKELDRIEQEADRLDDLIAQVLTISRLEQGNQHNREDYIDLAILLQEIVKDAQYEANARHRRISLHAPQKSLIQANTELLHRALENIIRNACFYTNENTEVSVELKISQTSSEIGVNQKAYEIIICDQGPGVAEERLPSIFEPFVRLSGSRTRDRGGYGLGLAIAQRAIQLHHGKLTARNRHMLIDDVDGNRDANMSNGLCFTIILPFSS